VIYQSDKGHPVIKKRISSGTHFRSHYDIDAETVASTAATVHFFVNRQNALQQVRSRVHVYILLCGSNGRAFEMSQYTTGESTLQYYSLC
jgi:hypothetical protein